MASRDDEDRGHPPPYPQERHDASSGRGIDRPAHAQGWGHPAGGGLGDGAGAEPQGAVYGSGQWGDAPAQESPLASELPPPREQPQPPRGEATRPDDPLTPTLPQPKSPGASS